MGFHNTHAGGVNATCGVMVGTTNRQHSFRKGFHGVEQRFDGVEKRFDGVEQRAEG